MNRPEISIIVPIYNTEKYLKRCIDSILSQSFSNFELILVDDGSTDASGSICDNYKKVDSRIKVIHKSNQGVSGARNSGLNIAIGKYIGFVDSDDYIDCEMYDRMYAVIVKEHAQICCCGYFYETKEHTYIKSCKEYSVYYGTESIIRTFCRQDYETGLSTGNCVQLIERHAIDNVYYKNYAYGEDIDFQFLLYKRINKLVCIPDVFYHYIKYERDDSASNGKFNESYLSVLRVADDVLKYVIENYCNIHYEAYAFHLTWYMAVLQKLYDSGWYNINKLGYQKYINLIREEVFKNFKNYSKNKYAKRLDKYYMYALLYHYMPVAITFRNIVLKTRKLFK